MTKALSILTHDPVVYTRDGEVFANSFDVAGYFKKEHRTIFKAAERLLEEDPGCGAHLRRTSISLEMPNGGIRNVAGFEMTQAGFTLVGMGLTGKAAIAFKLRYIDAFETMREELKRRQAPVAPVRLDLTDPTQLLQVTHQALQLLTEKTAQLAIVNAQVEAAKPAVEFYGAYADANGLIGIQNAARILGERPNVFAGWLRDKGYLFYQGKVLIPKQTFIERGWFEVKTTVVDDRAHPRTWVTPKGVQALAKLLDKPADLFGRLGPSRSIGEVLRH